MTASISMNELPLRQVREPHHLLMRAFFQPLPEAAEWWQHWRARVDLDKVDNNSFCMLPALAGRMEQWVAGDPDRDILLGICRRAWSQNQLRRKLLAEALELLRSAGNETATAIGPLAWERLYWPDGAIRITDAVDIVVEPSSVRFSLEVFTRAGWNVHGGLPDWSSDKFYFARAIRMRTVSGEEVRLHWRDLPNTDFALHRPPPPQFERIQQKAVYTSSAERDLVLALGGDFDSGLDWRCDALAICRKKIDWDVVGKLLRWRSGVKIRLEELSRDWALAIPQSVASKIRSGRVERMLTAPLRAYRSARNRALERS